MNESIEYRYVEESADKAIVFEYDMDLENGKVIIPTRSIPDGNYSASIKVTDVLGNTTEKIYKAHGVYDPDTFDIAYRNIGTVKVHEPIVNDT